jgi:hypothetical protein
MKKLLFAAILLGLSLPGWSETLINTPFLSVVGPGIGGDGSAAVSWTMSSGFQNVSIAAPLYPVYPALHATGTAYLASAGANTPISSAPFVFPDTPLGGANHESAYVTFFNNLTLLPGTYYLTLMSDAPAGGGWAMTLKPVVVETAPSVTLGLSYSAFKATGPYLGFENGTSEYFPLQFVSETLGLQITGDLTGDPVVTATPEPPTYALFLGLSLVGLAFTRRRVSLDSL